MLRACRFGVLSIVLLVGTAGPEAQQKAGPVPDPAKVPRIVVADLMRLYDARDVLIVDVRSVEAFRAGHIAGAIHVALADIGKRAKEIQKMAVGQPVVTYCSCPAEHSSAEAAAMLLSRGIKDARALVGGYPDWEKAGGKIGRAPTGRNSPWRPWGAMEMTKDWPGGPATPGRR